MSDGGAGPMGEALVEGRRHAKIQHESQNTNQLTFFIEFMETKAQ